MTSGVFFHPLASSSRLADTFELEILLDQLPPPCGHGIRIHADECGDPLISAIAQFERLQSGIQAALLFIQPAEEQNNGRLQFLRNRFALGQTASHTRLGFKHPALSQLMLPPSRSL